MSEQTSRTAAAKTRRQAAKAPPAWLITGSLTVFAIVTILLVVFGQ